MRVIHSMGLVALALAGAFPCAAGAAAETSLAPTEAESLPLMPAMPLTPLTALEAPSAALLRLALAPLRVAPHAGSDTGLDAGAAVGAELLERARGGTDTVSNEANLNGVVSGNAAINVSTGNNIINGAAFSNAAGIPMVIQNSGANVLIQNATIVNLQLR